MCQIETLPSLPPVGQFNIKTPPYPYRDSHYKDKMVMRPSLSLWWEFLYHTWKGYSGYFLEPLWKSMGHPEISRVTWQLGLTPLYWIDQPIEYLSRQQQSTTQQLKIFILLHLLSYIQFKNTCIYIQHSWKYPHQPWLLYTCVYNAKKINCYGCGGIVD